eukprot:6287709-Pyramimonas_sp.AAC.1
MEGESRSGGGSAGGIEPGRGGWCSVNSAVGRPLRGWSRAPRCAAPPASRTPATAAATATAPARPHPRLPPDHHQTVERRVRDCREMVERWVRDECEMVERWWRDG